MLEYIYGYHNITGLLGSKPQLIKALYLDEARKDKRVKLIQSVAALHKLNIHYISSTKLDKLVGSNIIHQGFIAQLEPVVKQNLNLDELLTKFKTQSQTTILILDGVTDPHNLGAIIRTAECFGCSAIILPKNNSANPSNSAVAKVSSGAIHYIPIVVVNNLAMAINKLKQHDFWIAGTVLAEESINLFDFKPTAKMAWVVGSESLGVRRLVMENCDYLVNIPTSGVTQSLNVSVATGVILSYNSFIVTG